MTFVALTALFLTVASLLVIGGAALALFLFFPLFLLALLGIVVRVGDRTVEQRTPSMDPTGWRNGS